MTILDLIQQPYIKAADFCHKAEEKPIYCEMIDETKDIISSIKINYTYPSLATTTVPGTNNLGTSTTTTS